MYENDDGSYQFIVWDFASEKSIRSGSVNRPGAIDFSADGSLLVVARGEAIVIESLDRIKNGEKPKDGTPAWRKKRESVATQRRKRGP